MTIIVMVIMITTIIMIMNIIVIMIILIMIIIIMTIQSNLFSRDPTVLSKSTIAENTRCVSAASLLTLIMVMTMTIVFNS